MSNENRGWIHMLRKSIIGTCCVTLFTNQVIGHEWGKECIVIRTNNETCGKVELGHWDWHMNRCFWLPQIQVEMMDRIGKGGTTVLHQQALYLLILELDSTCFILALYYSRKGQDVEGASKVGSSVAQKTIKCQVLSGVLWQTYGNLYPSNWTTL